VRRSRLSALDESFLRLETPSAHMHVAWKGVFHPPAGGRPPVTLERLRASIGARLHRAERFRQRLAFPPGGMAEPVWVDDPAFHIARHVIALSDFDDAVSRERFDTLADLVLSQQLERDRPLWRVYLVPRLADGRVGLVMKVHHAMVDGKSAVELALLLLDVDPDAVPPDAPPPARRTAPPSGPRLAMEAVVERTEESLRSAAALARPAGGARIASTLRRAALSLSEDVLRPAPASFVNTPIGPRRTLVGHAAELAPLLAIKRRYRATLNDACLAVIAGALRALALDRGDTPQRLKVMVPVSVRDASEAADLGNRISFVFVELPVHLSQPVVRMRAVQAATRAFKEGGRAAGAETILSGLSLLPGPLKDTAARFAGSARMYNLTISNIPGPRFPVYLLGAELAEAYPVVPLSEGHALSIGIHTHRDQAFFGAYADPGAFPQVADLPAALSAETVALASAAPKRTPFFERPALAQDGGVRSVDGEVVRGV
jgi:diacylglycerol O-acyltransferase / wax synthase